MLIPPLRLTASAFEVVAFFRAHNTAVALRQLSETGVTKALIKTLFGVSPAVHTIDLPAIFEPDALTQEII
jgi:hypothetical protein